MYCERVARKPRGPAPPLCLYEYVSADNGNEGGEKGEEAECVPQDTIAAKYEAYSEPNSPSHEGAHSNQEEISRISVYQIARARGGVETIDVETYFTGGGRRQTPNSSSGK